MSPRYKYAWTAQTDGRFAADGGGKCFVWTRRGRVGERGAFKLDGALDEAAAVKLFESKFKSKTGNAWSDRGDFVAKSGKYDLVEMDEVRLPLLHE